jgi:hypothetical protein
MCWLNKYLYLVCVCVCARAHAFYIYIYKLHSLCEDCLVSLHLLLCLSLWQNPELFYKAVTLQLAPAVNCDHAVPYVICLMTFPTDYDIRMFHFYFTA